MLNRRHIRIKVLQALYSWFQGEDNDIRKEEDKMVDSIEKIYQLYLFVLSLMADIHFESLKEREEKKNKYLPTAEDLKPQTNFTSNEFLKALTFDESFKNVLQKNKVSWSAYQDIVRQTFKKIRDHQLYKDYLLVQNPGLNQDKDFLIHLVVDVLAEDEVIQAHYEELNIHWNDDLYLVTGAIVKTIRDFQSGSKVKLSALYKDEEEDRKFSKDLFRKAIVKSDTYQQMIKEQAQNWEMDRIAMIDILLMKMAIVEFLEFPEIPVKVTLNEYIEISKNFSTPKSNIFINGILDKLVIRFKTEGTMKKTGRGLIDS